LCNIDKLAIIWFKPEKASYMLWKQVG
jgi:hypothetical protein